MSIPKKKLADVKRQAFKARAAEEKAEDHVPTPTRRQQLLSARMAARQVKTGERKPTKVKIVNYTPASNVSRMRFNLEVDTLVRINRDTVCTHVAPDAQAPWVAVKKGDIGILVGRFTKQRPKRGGKVLEFETGHVMLPQGLLEVDLSNIRAADESEEEG
jgi:hypothetical protein